MIQSQWITSVVLWERRLEFEDERRKIHRYEPYVNYLAPWRTGREERKSKKRLTPADFESPVSIGSEGLVP